MGIAMAYTVRQVAAVSRVRVRTLRFYDETGLLKPACYGANLTGKWKVEERRIIQVQ